MLGCARQPDTREQPHGGEHWNCPTGREGRGEAKRSGRVSHDGDYPPHQGFDEETQYCSDDSGSDAE